MIEAPAPHPARMIEARPHINRLRMSDLAYQYVYGEPVAHPPRVLLMHLMQEYTFKKYVKFQDEEKIYYLVEKSTLANLLRISISWMSVQNVKDQFLKTTKLGMFTCENTGFGPNLRKNYVHFSREQWASLEQLLALFSQIDRVVEAQISDPDNTRAGADFVPDEVYYDIALHRGS
jgi:hypothetical protein